MVDSPDVVHLKQLTEGNTSSRKLGFLMSKNKHSDTESSERNTASIAPSDPPVDLLQEGPATDKLLALAVRRSKMPAQKTVTSVIFAREKKKKTLLGWVKWQHLSLFLSLSDRGGEKTVGSGAGSRVADSSIRLSMKSLT